VRALFAWSMPPILLYSLILLSKWLVYYPDYYTTNQFLRYEPGQLGLWWVHSGITIIGAICILWFIAVLVVGLAEIGKGLVWSSLGTLVFSWLITFALFAVFAWLELLRFIYQ